jgi:hypothetical protein
MLRRFTIFLLAFVSSATLAFAGITGNIKGKVVDEDKNPLAGATVRVLGTQRGGKTKSDGTYFINNVTAGPYRVQVTYVGKDTAIKQVTVVADQTVDVDFKLGASGALKKEVIVVADKMVSSTAVGTSRVVDSKALTNVALDNVAAVVGRQAGVSVSGNGFQVRGSRVTESQVLVDGLQVTDQFTGGLGNSGATVSAAMPSSYATEQVDVKTGSFGAEYGNAIGGVVNTVVKTGKTDKFDVLMAWRKDMPFAFGYAGNGIQLGAPLEDQVDLTIGGPTGLPNTTFFVAVRNIYQHHRNFGLRVIDPIGNDLGAPPNNRTWSQNLTGRVSIALPGGDIRLLVGGLYGIVNGERNSWTWTYADETDVRVDNNGDPILVDGRVQSLGVPLRNAKQIAVFERSDNLFAQINHQLSENMFYDFRFSTNGKVTETARRRTMEAPGFLGKFDMIYPEDNMSSSDQYNFNDPNRIVDAYDLATGQRRSVDGFADVEVVLRNPLTGFVEGPADFNSSSNPYGLQGYFASRGNEGGVDLRSSRFLQLDGNLTYNLQAGETRHVVKTGFDFRTFRLTRHANSNPWDGSPFYDVFGTDYGPNLYIDVADSIPGSARALELSSQPYTPMQGSFYINDQMIFKSLVFTAGMRVDYLNTDALFRTSYDQFYAFGLDEGFDRVKPKFYVSPRMSITYPINENQNFALSYGIYYMAPPFAEFYDSFNAVQLRGSQVLGNPNMEMQRTNQYEVTYRNALTDDFAITATGFYKDVYNQSGLAYVRITPVAFFQRILADFGSSRGLELTFEKRTINNFGFNINYTLQQATGTANSANVVAAIDPITENPAYPVTEFPLGFDRRQRVNAAITLYWGRDEGPTIAGIPFLENINLTLSGFWQTGLPFTPVDGVGQATGEINSARQPSFWNSELRLIRTVPLQGVFGGDTELDLFLDVFNVFNFTGAIALYPRTQNPDYDGLALNREEGSFAANARFRDADPTRKETFAPNQYDRIGNRQYNALVDANGDGIVTQAETFAGYLRYVDDVIAQRGNYLRPRQVYFGLRLRF